MATSLQVVRPAEDSPVVNRLCGTTWIQQLPPTPTGTAASTSRPPTSPIHNAGVTGSRQISASVVAEQKLTRPPLVRRVTLPSVEPVRSNSKKSTAPLCRTISELGGAQNGYEVVVQLKPLSPLARTTKILSSPNGERLMVPKSPSSGLSPLANVGKLCVQERPHSVVRRPVRAKLVLPLPRRSFGCGGGDDATPPLLLPPTFKVPSGLPARQNASRVQSHIPARLQQLDDQTMIPREIYAKMLKAGDSARGIFGYAQHRLAFVGAEGQKVLQLVE